MLPPSSYQLSKHSPRWKRVIHWTRKIQSNEPSRMNSMMATVLGPLWRIADR